MTFAVGLIEALTLDQSDVGASTGLGGNSLKMAPGRLLGVRPPLPPPQADPGY